MTRLCNGLAKATLGQPGHLPCLGAIDLTGLHCRVQRCENCGPVWHKIRNAAYWKKYGHLRVRKPRINNSTLPK